MIKCWLFVSKYPKNLAETINLKKTIGVNVSYETEIANKISNELEKKLISDTLTLKNNNETKKYKYNIEVVQLTLDDGKTKKKYTLVQNY